MAEVENFFSHLKYAKPKDRGEVGLVSQRNGSRVSVRRIDRGDLLHGMLTVHKSQYAGSDRNHLPLMHLTGYIMDSGRKSKAARAILEELTAYKQRPIDLLTFPGYWSFDKRIVSLPLNPQKKKEGDKEGKFFAMDVQRAKILLWHLRINNIQKTDVWTYSAGVRVILAAIALDPDRFRNVVMLNPPLKEGKGYLSFGLRFAGHSVRELVIPFFTSKHARKFIGAAAVYLISHGKRAFHQGRSIARVNYEGILKYYKVEYQGKIRFVKGRWKGDKIFYKPKDSEDDVRSILGGSHSHMISRPALAARSAAGLDKRPNGISVRKKERIRRRDRRFKKRHPAKEEVS